MAVIYVPAGFEKFLPQQTTLFAKREKSVDETTTFTQNGYRWHNARNIVSLYKDKLNEDMFPEEEYDTAVPICGPAFTKLNDIKMVLINLTDRQAKHCMYKDVGVQVICDSGGFQLLQGTSDFVDPVKLADSYNKVCTLGMDLDIPAMIGITTEQKDAFTLIQKENHKVLKDLCKKIHIITINHGVTISDRVRHARILENFDSSFVSMAGLTRSQKTTSKKLLHTIEHICCVLSMYRNVKYLHCLGSTTKIHWIAYSMIDTLGLCKNIGGDSISYLHCSITGELYSYFDWKHISIPKKLHAFTPISCSCPICSNVKDLRIINSSNAISAMHCIVVQKHYVDFVNEHVKLYLKGEITAKQLKELVAFPGSASEIDSTRDYLIEFKETGKFKCLSKQSNTLFSTSQTNTKNVERANVLIHNYENYYGKRFL